MHILRLELHRFRRFEHLRWHPGNGINCLVGPGDGGKTSLLDAIALLFSPAPGRPAVERDYHRRDVESGFEIAAVLGGLSDQLLGLVRPPALWGWTGPEHELRDLPTGDTEPVLQLLVRGTKHLEVEHRLRSPDGEELPFSAEKRRELGLCRVGDLAETARELRMARGSLLERTLGSDELRGSAAAAVRRASGELTVSEDVTKRLGSLRDVLMAAGVTEGDLSLQLVAPPGQNLLGMLGLASLQREVPLPLSFAGQGTQRLAVFVLASALAAETPVVLVDELEVGLEPYRQRQMVGRIRDLITRGGQAFFTTHSPVVLATLAEGELHRLHWQTITEEPPDEPLRDVPALLRVQSTLADLVREDPEALLARLVLVCEGQTETRVIGAQLRHLAAMEGLGLQALGVRLVDGHGQPKAVDLVDALRDRAVPVVAWLDEERQCVGRRNRLREAGVTIGTFKNVTSIESALASELPIVGLEEFLDIHEPMSSRVGESRRQQLGEAVGRPGVTALETLVEELGSEAVRTAWAATAASKRWFKSVGNAEALGEELVSRGLPPKMQAAVNEFWHLVKPQVGASSAAASQDIPHEPR